MGATPKHGVKPMVLDEAAGKKAYCQCGLSANRLDLPEWNADQVVKRVQFHPVGEDSIFLPKTLDRTR